MPGPCAEMPAGLAAKHHKDTELTCVAAAGGRSADSAEVRLHDHCRDRRANTSDVEEKRQRSACRRTNPAALVVEKIE